MRATRGGSGSGSAHPSAMQPKSPAQLAALTTKVAGSGLCESLSAIPAELVEALYKDEVSELDLERLHGLVKVDNDDLTELLDLVSQWNAHEAGEAESTSLWLQLADCGVAYRSLMLVLHMVTKSQGEGSLTAARIVIGLLRVPGNANVFNPIVLRSSVNVAKQWARVNEASQSKATRKTKKASKDNDDEDEAADLFDDDEDDTEMEWLLAPALHAQVFMCVRVFAFLAAIPTSSFAPPDPFTG